MRWGRLAIAALLAQLLCASLAWAYDDAVIVEAEQSVDTFRLDLKVIEAGIQTTGISDEQLSKFRGQLEDIRARAAAQIGTLTGPIGEVNQQIGLLGPPATEGKTEAESVAAQRKQLNEALSQLQGPKSQLELVTVEAEQLAGRISSIQRSQFVTRIFEGSRSIFNPQLWFETGIGFGLFVTSLVSLLTAWWAVVRGSGNFAGLALIPVFLVIFASLYLLVCGRIRRWNDTNLTADREPDDIARLWRIASSVGGTFAVLIILFGPVYLSLQISGFMTPRFELVFNAAVDVVFVTAICWVIARRVAAPGKPAWRIVDLDDIAAARLPVLAGLIALVSAATRGLGKIADGLYLPVTYTIGQSGLSAIVILLLQALILLALRRQQGLPGKTPGRRVYFGWAAKFVPLLWLLIGIGVTALLTGYVALANFLSSQIFGTAILLTALFLGHHLADAAVVASFDPQSGFGRLLRKATGLGERGIERLGILFRTSVDLVLVIAGLPLLFVLWAITWIDFRGIVNTAYFGFRTGDITISPWSVLAVIMVLVGGIVLTNLVIRWFDRRILRETRIDKGVQDSLRKGASYAGYILSAAFALTAAGVEFSNLAIIAGALGVGIGFGLQSIVNNFVSGLILLAERPVRVGDWVALSSGEGIVKRINVRSTEIETFDSCSIIVPNSSLITEAVKNWTHGDTMGRFTVAVSVAYDSNAETVRDLLLGFARAHPKVLTYPEPQVTLSRFGLYGLDFEVKANVADVFEAVFVASDLRFTILKAFAEKGITIPQPVALMQGP